MDRPQHVSSSWPVPEPTKSSCISGSLRLFQTLSSKTGPQTTRGFLSRSKIHVSCAEALQDQMPAMAVACVCSRHEIGCHLSSWAALPG